MGCCSAELRPRGSFLPFYEARVCVGAGVPRRTPALRFEDLGPSPDSPWDMGPGASGSLSEPQFPVLQNGGISEGHGATYLPDRTVTVPHVEVSEVRIFKGVTSQNPAVKHGGLCHRGGGYYYCCQYCWLLCTGVSIILLTPSQKFHLRDSFFWSLRSCPLQVL